MSALEVDVWPPARPSACARLVIAREDEAPDPRWSGVQFTENLLPADGNPNHLHLTITRTPFNLNFGGDGDVQNPDSHLTFFTAYMAWWADSTACGSCKGGGKSQEGFLHYIVECIRRLI